MKTSVLVQNQQALQQAHALEKQGNLQAAVTIYQQLLRQNPGDAAAMFGLGRIILEAGNIEGAITLFTQLIRIAPGMAEAFNYLGIAQIRAKQFDTAITSLKQALALKPVYPEAQSNLASVYRSQKRSEEALELYKQALALYPESAELLNNMGAALWELKRFEEAEPLLRRALEIDPNHLEARKNLGVILKEIHQFDASKETFRELFKRAPDHPEGHGIVGIVHMHDGEYEEAANYFKRAMYLSQDHGSMDVVPGTVTFVRVKHDLEQVQYLDKLGKFPSEFNSYKACLEDVYGRMQSGNEKQMQLTPAERTGIAPSYNRIIYRAEAPVLKEGAINPDLDKDEIEDQFLSSTPEILIVDQLLRPEALNGLRNYCLESTVWKQEYPRGYLGTLIRNGFGSPLLIQTLEELRKAFPRIFRDHLLDQAWAFKYDSTMHGINPHADAAAININFWITPDEANQDPETGGLLLWDVPAPDDWPFKDYNSNTEKILDFLKDKKPNERRVSHRQNRALIFNSTLFHKTDEFHFNDRYEHRRINITLLYGQGFSHWK
ncbi:MAG: tetratricopeptide repeat protein [Hyphomicrobiales bacterium]|nr:tetratricopeptide repeat protein [Rickettsiales bacterium]MCP5362327.1 tetratricopeptide repeat protein [Hyphomicrobiales bacterium]